MRTTTIDRRHEATIHWVRAMISKRAARRWRDAIQDAVQDWPGAYPDAVFIAELRTYATRARNARVAAFRHVYLCQRAGGTKTQVDLATRAANEAYDLSDEAYARLHDVTGTRSDLLSA